MNAIILYGSQYGSARRYAEHLAQQTGIAALRYQDAPPLADLPLIVYLGGLYAGGVLGLRQTLRGFSPGPGQRLLLATVGLADPAMEENRDHIRRALQRQLPAGIWAQTRLFHLRGAMDYARLTRLHRTMMALLHRSLQKRPAQTWSEEDRALMETYGKRVDFVDLDALRPLAAEIERGRHG